MNCSMKYKFIVFSTDQSRVFLNFLPQYIIVSERFESSVLLLCKTGANHDHPKA